jgi:hypothetical protein
MWYYGGKGEKEYIRQQKLRMALYKAFSSEVTAIHYIVLRM